MDTVDKVLSSHPQSLLYGTTTNFMSFPIHFEDKTKRRGIFTFVMARLLKW